ncbi:unnamed protein product, partial [Diabrotica balteata]
MSNNNSNNASYLPAMFSTPPPMLSNASNWNGFKYPPQRQSPGSPRYRNPLIINGESPRNITSSPSEYSSTSNNTYMSSNVAQAQGPPIFDLPPPPPVNTSTAYAMNTSMQSLASNSFEGNANYQLMYRYANPAQFQYAMNSAHSNPYQLGPSIPFTSSQPPLPPVPPPENPPPPPPPSSMAQSHQALLQNSHYANFHNRIQFSPMFGYQKQNMYKRRYDGDGKKLAKKKKKPLSQVVPQKRDWSLAEARKALEVEKECNKNSKRQGLIIKFPDIELNRDIVSNFHSSIDSVHFQQPSTPRYCFITLRESADPETVIRQLNQIPFGLGYLTAEFKKDREDEQNLQPSDIDPLTLYVGNLAQEITKEDIIKTYPKQKRIDIGYAKKMKYTRYAFVSFYNVDDAVEAFQNTHSAQLYSKSLIVRFRRLHGTVGMPGEPKQNTPRPDSASTTTSTLESVTDSQDHDNSNQWDIDISNWDSEDTESQFKRSESPYTSDEEEQEESSISPLRIPLKREAFESPRTQHGPVPNREKKNIKPPGLPLETNIVPIAEEEDIKPPRSPLKTLFTVGSVDLSYKLHRPISIKEDKELLEVDRAESASERPITHDKNSNNDTKPEISDIKHEGSKLYSNTSYDHLRALHKQLRSAPVKVKIENDIQRDNERSSSNVSNLDRVSEKDRTSPQRNEDIDLTKDKVINSDKEIEKTAEVNTTNDRNTISNWDDIDEPVAVKTEKGKL